MSLRLQNFLIGASLIGILVYFSTDVFNKNYNPPTKPKEKITLVTPMPTEGLSECTGPYFDVKEGAIWEYKITTTNAESKVTSLTTRLTGKSLDRMDFLTVDSASGKKTPTRIVCKLSGIYGLPIPLFDSAVLNGFPSEITDSLTQNVLFIPNKKVYKNKVWSSEIDISSFLPIKSTPYLFSLNFKVVDSGDIILPGKKRVQGITVQTSANPQGSIDLSSFFKVGYRLGEKMGLIDGLVTVKIPSKPEVEIKIELVSFSSPL